MHEKIKKYKQLSYGRGGQKGRSVTPQNAQCNTLDTAHNIFIGNKSKVPSCYHEMITEQAELLAEMNCFN